MSELAELEDKRKQRQRNKLRERFRKAAADPVNRRDVERIMQEWKEVDEESARRLADLEE